MKKLALTMFALAAAVAIGTPAQAQPKTDTTTTLTFSANPVAVGDPATVTATVSTAPSDPVVEGGKLRVKWFLLDGAHVSCGVWADEVTYPGTRTEDFDELDPVNDGANAGVFHISHTADTSVAGFYGYAGQYIPSGGADFNNSQAACADLVVEETCAPSGLSIAIAETFGSSEAYPGSTYTGGFTVTVKNCGPGTAPWVTAQGGTSGWTDYQGHVASPGTSAAIRNQNKRNEVLLWTIGDMPENTEQTLKVFLEGYIKPNATPGDILYLSGAWSALSAGVKTPYTGRVTITVSPTP